MFIAGTNFVLSYYGFKLNFKKIFKDEEFKTYSSLIILFTLIVALSVYLSADVVLADSNNLEDILRHSLFQVVSIITTTGFVTADYTSWGPLILLLFFGTR